MKLHANATSCPKSRLLLCKRVIEQGWTRALAAEAADISERTAAKWLTRYRAEGSTGLMDRPSRPLASPNRVPEERMGVIAGLRRLRMTAAEIAECLAMPLSTVSAVLVRIGLGKRSALSQSSHPTATSAVMPESSSTSTSKSSGLSAAPGTASWAAERAVTGPEAPA